MGVFNIRDDRAERNRGYVEVPLSTVIPRAGHAHLQQNPILDSFLAQHHRKIQAHLCSLPVSEHQGKNRISIPGSNQGFPYLVCKKMLSFMALQIANIQMENCDFFLAYGLNTNFRCSFKVPQ